MVGDFGTDRLPHFTVASRASQHASELERLSADYGTSILVAKSTRAAAESEFAFLEIDAVLTRSGDREPLHALVGTPVSRANPKFLALKAFHERIFEAYRAKEWAKARELIEQCRGLSGANPVLYDFYLKRIAHLESDPSGRLERQARTFRRLMPKSLVVRHDLADQRKLPHRARREDGGGRRRGRDRR